MADTTKLIIDIESRLKNLEKTLQGLAKIRKSLQSVANVKAGTQQTANVNKAAAATQRLQQQQQRAAITAQRLAQAQQAVTVRAQQLANAQTRAQQTTQRLGLAQQRLNATTANLTARLGKQADAHVRAFRAIEAASKKTQQTILGVGNALRGLGQGLASAGATLSVSVTPLFVGLGAATVNAAVQLDSLRRGLAAITGSSEEAGRQLQRLTQLARLPGIGFEEAIQGSIRLQAVGFSAAEAERNLREFSNAIALTGGGRDELARVTVQLGQLAAKGKVLSQDLRPIIEAAPAVGRALLEAFGTVNSEDIQDLGLSTKQFLDILVGQLGQLPRAAAGAKNSFENFRDELFRAAAVLGETVLPALTRLVEVVGPGINLLANLFGALSTPTKVLAVTIGVLAAGLGPVLFVTGQLVLAVGRLVVGFVQLNTAGIGPTIANLRALTAGTLGAAAAQRTLATTTALVTAGLGAVIGVLTLVVTAFLAYKAFQKDSITLSREQVDALTDQINGLKQQAKFIDSLQGGVKRTADEQERLLSIYDKLNITAQTRITGIREEDERLAALREELQRLIQAREQERIQGAAALAATIARNALLVESEDAAVQSLALRVQANTELIKTLETTGKITPEISAQLQRFAVVAGGDAAQAINALQKENENLVRRQNELREAGKETRNDLKEQIPIFQQLTRDTQRTGTQLLVTAQTMGLFDGNVQEATTALRKYITETNAATLANDAFNASLARSNQELLKAGARAENEAKRRREQIGAAAAVARETSVSFDGALKSLRQMMDAVPQLRADVERELELTGKSLEEFLRDALESAFKGRDKAGKDSGASLRNAQQQLAQALTDLALASSERQIAIEQAKNDRLLQAAESAQRLGIISYRQFLETRAALAADSIDREITQQASIVAAAKKTQVELLNVARQGGIPEAERVRRQAQAAEANETAIKAETRLAELQAKRELITDGLNQSIREAQQQQLRDTRQLEIEYAELTGRIEESLNAATDEKFQETLQDLALAQDHLNRKIERATRLKNADELAELRLARSQNQRQIEVIQNIINQERATNRLAAANEFVSRAKEKQADLERDLAFQVEFRGLTEEEAIARRLEGERKLADSLRVSRDIVQSTIDALNAQGVKPPQALLDFIREVNDATRGLGELPFSEQFRLAQKEFDRINDERIAKIEDVERAVRNRDIAEVEGAIIIRRINNQYTADLEAQLALLRQIADASRDRGLQQQAADAAETVKDAKDEVASFSKQIDAAGKDAFRSGLTDFFNDILNRTATAKEALLNLLNSVTRAINDVIAENLSKALFESIFGGADQQAGGLIATVKRLFGFGSGDEGKAAAGAVDSVAGKATDTAAATALQAAATASATALTTGGTTAGTAMATGGTTAGASLVASMTAAAAAFASAVIAAGTAFAASVAAGAGTQAIGGLGGALGAETGIFPAVPGGMYRFVEGGYPEAVLTTDPKHAVRQVAILREFLQRTRGLQGRIPKFASGAMVSRETAELNLLSGIHRAVPSMGTISEAALARRDGRDVTLRQIFVDDQRDISNWYNSAEGDRVQVQWLQRNRPTVRRILGV